MGKTGLQHPRRGLVAGLKNRCVAHKDLSGNLKAVSGYGQTNMADEQLPQVNITRAVTFGVDKSDRKIGVGGPPFSP